MNNPPFPQWTAQNSDAQFAMPGAFASKASKFEQRIRRRNWFEYAAGVVVIAVFASVAWLTSDVATPIMTTAWVAAIIGVMVVMVNLARFGSNLERKPELDCRTHLRVQLARQRDALKSISWWYLGPLVPGVALIHIARAYEASLRIGWADAIIDVTPSALFAILIFAAVRWLNMRAAGKLDEEIAELDRMAKS